MFQGLLYKEWIKVKWALLIAAGITLFTLFHLFLSVKEYFEFVDAIKVWESAIHRKTLFYSGLQYNALIAGIAIALVQFVPETLKKRLKLLFHLPVDHNRSLYFMMAVGTAGTLAVIALNVAGMLAVIPSYFPAEVLVSALITAAPWFFAGIVAYFATVLVVVEPVWWRKLLYAAVSYFFITLYFNGRGYNTYANSLWLYALLGCVYFLTIVLPGFRFKRGLY